MPEDRFGDLGEPRKPSAAERFEHEDRVNPEPDDPARRRPEVPRPGNRYAWAVGILALMGISVLLFTTSLPNKGAGVRGPQPGETLPAFAAPLATSNVNDDFDANVFQAPKDAASAGKRLSACEVRTESVLNSCELRRRPTVLTMIATEGTDCEPQVDRVERMRKAFPQVNFAVVMSGEKRSEAERIVRRRGWGMPVGVDRDGAVTNLYGVGVCPTTVFSDGRGIVRRTDLGNLTEKQLSAHTRALLRRR
ncbi:MAG TPA: redoxin domain-containing protein [Thermoleophilaceae bacterium]|nr:redoxin domain-containing protein [Thermoleophilaceae bacterium]